VPGARGAASTRSREIAPWLLTIAQRTVHDWVRRQGRSATPPAAAVAPDPNGIYLTITVVNLPALGSLVTPATPGRYSLNGNEFGIPGFVYMINVGAT